MADQILAATGDKITLPPDHGSPYRKNVGTWTQMYERDSASVGKYAPNYARWLARICSGLMQSLPPRLSFSKPAKAADGTELAPDEQFDHLDAADLLDEGTERAAALGVAFLRPVHDGQRWTIEIVDPSNTHAVWQHRRLSSALVWSIMDHPHKVNGEDVKIALVEEWVNIPAVAATTRSATLGGELVPAQPARSTVSYRVYRGKFEGGKFEGTELPIDSLSDAVASLPTIAGALTDRALDQQDGTTDRRLDAIVWAWHKGRPAPVYVGNEDLVVGLERLADNEQGDAEMARNRIALDARMLSTKPVLREGTNAVLAEPGMSPESNVLLLEKVGGTSQGIADSLPFHVIKFPDSLTQRDRIERRESSLLMAVGINPQSVGKSVTGRTDSGVAKRTDQQMTLQTIAGPARRASKALGSAYTQLVTLDPAVGDVGTVSVAVVEGLRPTAEDSATTAADLSAAGAASTVTLIRTAHPTWSDAEVEAEHAAMIAEGLATSADDADPDDGLSDAERLANLRTAGDTLGVLARAGVDQDDAAAKVGLADVDFVGSPTSVRPDKTKADQLETK